MKVAEMELLVRVAEAGSMTRAARQLHLTPAAVSASVQRIEDAVGVRVFERTTRTLHPTEEGLVIIEGCRDVVDLWERTLDDARDQTKEREGTVHVAAPADTAFQVLGPVVAELCSRQPRLRVVVDTSDTPQHLHRDAIDMAIRYGVLQDSTLSARKLGAFPGVLVAAPSYLAEAGTPRTPRSLAGHRCLTLQLGGAPNTTWRLGRGTKQHSVDLDSPLCGDGLLARQWAIDGRGIALKSLFDVVDDLESGRLVRVLPDWASEPSPIHAVFPGRRFITARVRALHTAIASAFHDRAARCDAWLHRDGT